MLLQLLCCYCYSDIEFCYNCYYERVIDIGRTRRHCYSETATATAIAYADDSAARVALLRAIVVRVVTAFPESMNYYADAATATAMLLLLLRHRVLLQLLLRTRYRYCSHQETLLL